MNGEDTEQQEKEKVGLEALDNDALVDIVQKELEGGEGLDQKHATPGRIAFYELAKRSGWKVD